MYEDAYATTVLGAWDLPTSPRGLRETTTSRDIRRRTQQAGVPGLLPLRLLRYVLKFSASLGVMCYSRSHTVLSSSHFHSCHGRFSRLKRPNRSHSFRMKSLLVRSHLTLDYSHLGIPLTLITLR